MAAQSSDSAREDSSADARPGPDPEQRADTADSAEPTSTVPEDRPETADSAPNSGATVSKDRVSNSEVPKSNGEAPKSKDPEPTAARAQHSPALIATAVALPVALVVAVLIIAIFAGRMEVEREPLALGPVPAPNADGPACAALLPALPIDLGELTKSTIVEPAPPATRAWQPKEGGDAVVLRCGLDRPLEFDRASPLQLVDGVQWFELRDDTAKVSTWVAVDRATYVAVTIPDGSGPTPLQTVSDALAAALPAQPIDPGPLPN
ncbi:DUF3515 domain-containing protein [Nocardia callitridis]|uniref:DUF3515 domain-containing protein n=1 Tax=Nocardia callitridis TaxID=648753 RepID=A0ABP9KRZ7_9NOCA